MEIAQTADLNVRNEHGQTLMFAAAGRPSMKGSAEVLCRMLQERGLAVDALDIYQQTPLFAVAREGNETCADYLIALGANPNHADLRGETPLCVAFRNSQMELVMRLLDEPICYSIFFLRFLVFFCNCCLYFVSKQASKESKRASKEASKEGRKQGNKQASQARIQVVVVVAVAVGVVRVVWSSRRRRCSRSRRWSRSGSGSGGGCSRSL